MKREINPETGRKFNNLTDEKFGRWTVQALTGKRGFQTTWRCVCECGTVKEDVLYGSLTNGGSLSCGCIRSEQLSARALKHGMTHTRAHNAWGQMKDRCTNETRRSWAHYGGRGIKVCDRWMNSFDAFLADMGEPGYGESLDRINNDGNYEPSNCRWATRQEQARNTRQNRWYDWKGESRTLTDIARMEGVSFCSLRNRILGNQGVKPMDSVEAAVNYCRKRNLKFKERAEFLLG